MAYNGTKQIVIDSATNIVKRIGFCDMTNDGVFDSENETVIEADFDFTSHIDEFVWTWNGSTFIAGASQPTTSAYGMMQQIDVNKDSKTSSYKTVTRMIYLGSEVVGNISVIEAIAYMDASVTSYDLRIVDKGNDSAVVAEITGLTNTEDAIIDLGAISNLSQSKTRFDVQIKVVGGNNSNKGYLDSILIKY